MARSDDEKVFLGDATEEELKIFEKEKEFDETVKAEVKKTQKEESVEKDEDLSEEALRIKREGEKEILKTNKELGNFLKKEEELKKEKEKNPEKFKEKIEDDDSKQNKIGNKFINFFVSGFEKINKKTFEEKISLVKAILIVFLTLITVVLSFVTVMKYRQRRENGTYIKLSLPKNDEFTSRILVNENLELFDEKINLGRITTDTENTVFYFDSLIDFKDKYRATLLDTDNRYYAMNTHFMDNVSSSVAGKVAAFAPLPNGIRRFKLEIVDNHTSEKQTFYFEFDKFLVKQPSFKAYSTVYESNNKIKFENIVATESGTVVNYSLNWPESENYYYGIDNYYNGNATLTHNLTPVPLKTGEIVAYNFEDYNLMLLEGDYTPLKSYKGILELAISNIYKIYDIDKTYDTKEILLKKAEINIPLDDYTFVIEGMDKSDDRAVLVYHLDNNNYVLEEEKDKEDGDSKEENKVEDKVEEYDVSNKGQVYYEVAHDIPRLLTLPEIEIVVLSGEYKYEIIKPKEIYAGEIGGDVLFDDKRLAGLTSRDFKVRIKKVKIKEADYFAKVNLDFINKNGANDENVKEAIENIKVSFNKRLAFKSGEITKSKITGFDRSILIRPEFNNNYSPQDLVKKAFYGTNIVSLAVKGNNIHAIVTEEWRGQKENEFLLINKQHEIVYDIERGLIIYDVVK